MIQPKNRAKKVVRAQSLIAEANEILDRVVTQTGDVYYERTVVRTLTGLDKVLGDWAEDLATRENYADTSGSVEDTAYRRRHYQIRGAGGC